MGSSPASPNGKAGVDERVIQVPCRADPVGPSRDPGKACGHALRESAARGSHTFILKDSNRWEGLVLEQGNSMRRKER